MHCHSLDWPWPLHAWLQWGELQTHILWVNLETSTHMITVLTNSTYTKNQICTYFDHYIVAFNRDHVFKIFRWLKKTGLGGSYRSVEMFVMSPHLCFMSQVKLGFPWRKGLFSLWVDAENFSVSLEAGSSRTRLKDMKDSKRQRGYHREYNCSTFEWWNT